MSVCLDCRGEIPVERLEHLPDTEYCVNCAPNYETRKVGFMVFDHKTAPELVIVDEADAEALRRASKANRREIDLGEGDDA